MRLKLRPQALDRWVLGEVGDAELALGVAHEDGKGPLGHAKKNNLSSSRSSKANQKASPSCSAPAPTPPLGLGRGESRGRLHVVEIRSKYIHKHNYENLLYYGPVLCTPDRYALRPRHPE